jgi:pyroglutamyl-peptidase
MYGVLHHIAVNALPIRAGWIHLPALPSVAALEANLGMPSMTAETARRGVVVAIGAALDHVEDIREPIRSAWQI